MVGKITSGGRDAPATPEGLRQVIALERIAAAIEKFGKPDGVVGGVPIRTQIIDVKDAAEFRKPSDATVALSNRLLAWFGDLKEPVAMKCAAVLDDAIRQATDPKTIEWIAAIAERYGFKQ